MTDDGATRWLDASQQRSWRAFLVGTTLLLDRLEADLRWLDEVAHLTAGAEPFDLSDERPRRGRPARAPWTPR